MNNQDLKNMKKDFKMKKDSPIRIQEVKTFFIKKDQKRVLGSLAKPFDLLTETFKSLYLKNIKKIFSGTMDVKNFTYDFTEESSETKEILDNIRLNDNNDEYIQEFINKIASHYPYKKDTAVSFIKYSSAGYSDLLLITINQMKSSPTQISYFSDQSTFDIESHLDPIMATTPLEGFSYPCYEQGAFNQNSILYYNKKSNTINEDLIQESLGFYPVLTAKEEYLKFHNILNLTLHSSVSMLDLNDIYDELREYYPVETLDEERILTKDILQEVLDELACRYDSDALNQGFTELMPTPNYEFSIPNIIPKSSIQLKNSGFDLKVQPSSLDKIQKIILPSGEKVLQLKLDDDINPEGYNIKLD